MNTSPLLLCVDSWYFTEGLPVRDWSNGDDAPNLGAARWVIPAEK